MVNRTSKAKDSFDKQKRGYKAVVRGLNFEKKVGEFLSKLGYKIYYEKPIAKARFDIFGKRTDNWGYGEYYIAECKDKSRVTATDVIHFMSKLRTFYNHLSIDIDGDKPKVQGLLAYTGELPADARNAAKGFKPSIKFKKF